MKARSCNVLVTGATGFLGGCLARRLHAAGWQVTALGRNETAGRKLEADGIRFLRVDLADEEAVIRACEGQEFIFHAAARSAPWGRYADFFRDNVLATKNIVSGCLRHEVGRLIHISTPSIYFDYQDRLNIPETQPPADVPANHYIRTKLQAEAVVDEAAARGLNSVTLRPRAIFGPGDTTLFPRLIRAHGKKGFPLIGGNDPFMDITYVDNVADAMMLAAAAPESATGKKFNVTNGEPWLRSRLIRELFLAVDRPLKTRQLSYRTTRRMAAVLETFSHLFTFGCWEPPLTCYTVGVLAKTQTLDISAARSVLGYQPRITITEGLRLFGNWWKGEGRAC